MVASRVFIARHGERIDHVDPSWKKRAANPDDPYLSERGLSQARCLGQRLAAECVSKIFVSPFYRTIQTAAAVADAANASLFIEPGICEGLLSDWFPRGMPVFRNIGDIVNEFPCVDATYVPVHNPAYPETKKGTMERVGTATKKIVEKEDGTILLVGHGITCEGSARGLLGIDNVEYIDYCALMEVVQTGSSTALTYAWAGNSGPDISYMHEDIR